MRRRKKDDKRVLKPRYNKSSNNNSRKKLNFRRNNKSNTFNSRNSRNPRRAPKQNKTSKATLILMIVALLAFVIGAGAGISMALGSDDDSEPHYENVTVEMTTHLNNTSVVIYDEEVDHIDFNSAEDRVEHNLTKETVSY